MKKLCFSLLLSLFCLAAPAQDQTRTYKVKGSVAAIEAYGNVEIDYKIAPTLNIKGTTSGMPMDALKVEKKGSTLVIYTEGNFKEKSYAKVTMSAPAIYSYDISGNVDMDVEGLLAGPGTLKVVSGGNATVDFEGDANMAKIQFISHGNSHISLDNVNSTALVIDASGNSSIEAKDMLLETVKVDASGNSHIDLHGNGTSGDYDASGNSVIDAYELKLSTGTIDASGNASVRCNIAEPKYQTSGNASISNK